MKQIKQIKYMDKKNMKTYKSKSKLNKTLKKMNCSPMVEGNTVNNQSCLTSQLLEDIKKEYNLAHPTNKVTSSTPDQTWKDLHSRFNTCDSEDCWIKKMKLAGMSKEIDEIAFAPEQPADWKQNPKQWLSNYDILDVIGQYEKTPKYRDFKFIGPTTIDFDSRLPEKGDQCVLDDLCNFSLSQFIEKGKTKIGIVFNLDRHDQPGSHWVSMFIDIKEKIVFYFDSAGANQIPKEINELIKRVVKQGAELENPIRFKLYHNSGIDHQKGNTECGMYSLFFIITMLTGKISGQSVRLPMKKRIHLFLKKRIPDDMVWNYRKIYFNA